MQDEGASPGPEPLSLSTGPLAEAAQFDFEAHRQAAVAEYLKKRDFFVDLSLVVQRIVQECLKHRTIKVNSVESRAKDAVSFGDKAVTPSDNDASLPKYTEPLQEITDLAGVRVITFFPSTASDIHKMIDEEFEIVEHSDKGAALVREERFGYQSIHYLVKLKAGRAELPEYRPFSDAVVEIQVRTILQHAWAEIEHDIQYKSASVIPTEIHRRFMALAGLLEIADREFQAIQNADSEITEQARASVERGDYDVEITPDALKAYLDRRIGVDGRMTRLSYEWAAWVLKNLGFEMIEQIDRCIAGYDDDEISRAAAGYRQGQITRFEYMLLAGMGEDFIARHPWNAYEYFAVRQRRFLTRFSESGIELRAFSISGDAQAVGLTYAEDSNAGSS